jgi:hypothetical protein
VYQFTRLCLIKFIGLGCGFLHNDPEVLQYAVAKLTEDNSFKLEISSLKKEKIYTNNTKRQSFKLTKIEQKSSQLRGYNKSDVFMGSRVGFSECCIFKTEFLTLRAGQTSYLDY